MCLSANTNVDIDDKFHSGVLITRCDVPLTIFMIYNTVCAIFALLCRYYSMLKDHYSINKRINENIHLNCVSAKGGKHSTHSCACLEEFPQLCNLAFRGP